MAYNFHSKYYSRKCEYDGRTFDSKREKDRYIQLRLWEEAGLIKDLQCQVKYIIFPTVREPDTIGPRGGVRHGKIIEKEAAYFADFVYTDCTTGQTVVEDVKSPATRTPEYILKRKGMLAQHGIRIKEVM
jgi:hypothetical protein